MDINDNWIARVIKEYIFTIFKFALSTNNISNIFRYSCSKCLYHCTWGPVVVNDENELMASPSIRCFWESFFSSIGEEDYTQFADLPKGL